jgi:methionine sulfoxide reductase heme-binding subunit
MKKYLVLLFAILLIIVPWRIHAAATSVAQTGQLAQESEQNDFEYKNNQGLDNTNTVVLPVNNTPVQNLTTTPSQTATPVQSTAFPWAWVINRSAGITSYILLALLTITGMSLTTGLLFRIFSPATAWSVHRAIGSALLVSVVIHVFSLLFDHFINLKILDLLIPFVSFYKPSRVALGISGFYLLLLLLATSLYTMTKYAKFWRTIHFFAFPMFILIFLHGVLIGTDTKQPWMQLTYWVTALLVSGFVIYRLSWKYRNRTA